MEKFFVFFCQRIFFFVGLLLYVPDMKPFGTGAIWGWSRRAEM